MRGDPIARFQELLAKATRVERTLLPEPTAFALATATPDGRPSARMLLLKGVDHRGLVFFTNLESRKGRELADNPRAALCFHWQPLEVQVRIEGPSEPVSGAEADEYFASRPRGSQISAWASIQSRPLESEAELRRRVDEIAQRFGDRPVPRPPHWSGIRVVPQRIEFWKNRADRLHERELYTRDGARWVMERLYP